MALILQFILETSLYKPYTIKKDRISKQGVNNAKLDFYGMYKSLEEI